MTAFAASPSAVRPVPVIAIHGGAGTLNCAHISPAQEQAYHAALQDVLRAGQAVLARGGSAVDAVCEAVRLLEECPLFNAGHGAVFTADATHELDAAVMDGANLAAGAVAGVAHVRNPVLAARAVMRHGQHVLMAGEGAERIARDAGLEMVEPSHFSTDARRAQLEAARASQRGAVLDHDGAAALAGRALDEDRKMGTVGAVALDAHGHLAAATSTGGMTNKRPGRVGDSPLIGAGTYADDRTAAVSLHRARRELHPRGGRARRLRAHGIRRPGPRAGRRCRGARRPGRHRRHRRPDRRGPPGQRAPAVQYRGHVPRIRPRGRSARDLHLPLRAQRPVPPPHDRPFFPPAMKPNASTASTTLALPEQRVLAVDDLTIRFANSERTVDAVRNLSFHVDRGETLAIVGESGSGKSVTSLALMRLVEHGGGRIIGGSVALRRRNGQVLDVARASNAVMRDVRGADVAMIFQEPMTSLNPVFTAGDQIAESIRVHQGKDRAAARAEALRMLELVRIPEARNVLDRFPTSSRAACASA